MCFSASENHCSSRKTNIFANADFHLFLLASTKFCLASSSLFCKLLKCHTFHFPTCGKIIAICFFCQYSLRGSTECTLLLSFFSAHRIYVYGACSFFVCMNFYRFRWFCAILMVLEAVAGRKWISTMLIVVVVIADVLFGTIYFFFVEKSHNNNSCIQSA